jgi:hypothetical protein
MERSVAFVRVREAIPTPIRIVGWVLLLGPVLAILPEGTRSTLPLRSLIGEGLAILGLGAGIAPLEFFAFTWLAVAVVFWVQAYFRGQGLGPKSTIVFGTALVAQAMLFFVTSAAR